MSCRRGKACRRSERATRLRPRQGPPQASPQAIFFPGPLCQRLFPSREVKCTFLNPPPRGFHVYACGKTCRGLPRRMKVRLRRDCHRCDQTTTCWVFIVWPNNHFNNLHSNISLETNKTTTCAAEYPLTFCELLKRRF